MNITELQERYIRTARILKKERRMREKVFQFKPDELETKLAEIDLALEDLEAMKDALKAHIQPVTQAALLELPVRAY